MLELYDSNLSLITLGKPSITRLCGTDELAAGTYYVKITDELNDEVISYDISLTVTPCSTSGGGCSDCPDSWSKVIPDSNDRFELVMGGAGVLDKETCLVWEQSPDTTTKTWLSALTHCFQSEVGGRGGWRLPTIEELASLKDTVNTNPALPSGHPFDTDAVQSSRYWSSTTNANVATFAWFVSFNSGFVTSLNKATNEFHVWCVRGGQGHDGGTGPL
jgi:hypothetical protein